jgi:hypothetical protein
MRGKTRYNSVYSVTPVLNSSILKSENTSSPGLSLSQGQGNFLEV